MRGARNPSDLHRPRSDGLDSEGDQQTVVDTARRRLELWDIPKDEIGKLEKTGNPGKSLSPEKWCLLIP
jgi:hypothetical protein